jgi:hypothetical protein
MYMEEAGGEEPPQGEKQCLQCQQMKPLLAFSRAQRKYDELKTICIECEQLNRHERLLRAKARREGGVEQQTWEERKRREWEKKVALRQTYEQHQQERERWCLQQPDRLCRMCHQILPASAFGGVSSINGFVFHTRCKTCHEELLTRHQPACCLCEEKLPRRDFLSSYDGYVLSCDGAWVSLCCRQCESAFQILPAFQQENHIRACCQKSFPSGQVIYAEIDPETKAVRYVGRTNNPERRHSQHLSDVSPTAALWGTEQKAWFTRGNWMYALAERGLAPSMQILQQIEISPLVVEWEQRFIWHGIQQGWKLLNVEHMDEALIARINASRLDFLQAPFEQLVQQDFFSSRGLAAFLRIWHQPEQLAR